MPYYGFLPLSGGTLTGSLRLVGVGSASTTFQYPTVSVGGNFSTDELLLTKSTGGNVLALLGASNSISALTARSPDDNREHFAIGYSNIGSGFHEGNCFIEISDFPNQGQTTAPPGWAWVRTGYVDGAYGGYTIMQLDGDNTGVIHYPGRSGSPSGDALTINQVTNVIDIQNKLIVGNLNTAVASPLATLDVYGTLAIGGSQSSSDVGSFAFSINKATTNQIRLINNSVYKCDILLNTSPARNMQFVDTDNSGLVVASFQMNGTGRVGIGTDSNVNNRLTVFKDTTDAIAYVANGQGTTFLGYSSGGVLGTDQTTLRLKTGITSNNPSNGTTQISITGTSIVLTPPLKLPSYTVSGLPSASTTGAGSLAFVTDGSTTAILGLGLTAVGGGANKYIVYSDGTNWIVI